MYKLFCFVQGENLPFCVVAGLDLTIAELQMEIKKTERERTWRARCIETYSLEGALFLVMLPLAAYDIRRLMFHPIKRCGKLLPNISRLPTIKSWK